MPSSVQLRMLLGPLVGIAPVVGLVLLGGVVALAALAACARAARGRRSLLFLLAWAVGVAALLAARLGLDVLWVLREGGRGVDLSLPGLAAYAGDHGEAIGGAAVAGCAMSVALALLRRRDGVRPSRRPGEAERASRIGQAGEQLVAAELALLGWPALHNVILVDDRGMTAEIDHLVRVADGIVVLETKAYTGLVTGTESSGQWTQHLAGGRRFDFLNPAHQNLGHVRAVERFVGDPDVRVRGFVVSAGRARFAPEIARVVVPVALLRSVLTEHVRGGAGRQAAIDQAWRRLGEEAARSGGRRATHLARVARLRPGSLAGFGLRGRA